MTRIISIVGGLQPSTPTIGTATDGGTGTSANVAFTASSYIGKGTITYTATSSPGGLTGTSATSPISVTGLTTGTAYTFTVTGTTNYGVTSLTSGSSNSVTPANPDSGAMFPLGVATVGATSSNQIVFSSIPQTYTHLQIRYIARTSSTNNEAVVLTFNNDNSGSYGWGNHRLEGDGSTASSGNGGGQPYTSMFLNTITPTGSTANVYAGGVIDILDYTNTNKNKVARGLGGFDANGSGVLNLSSGAYFKTDAITSISITMTTGYNYLQYSSFALYGIKGA